MDAIIAYRWDTTREGCRKTSIWCLDCIEEFQQCGDADADLTAGDITSDQTCDVCEQRLIV